MEKMKTKTKHGDTNSPEYSIWKAMKQRCHNPKSTHFDYYGGRGIKVCRRWFYSYRNFIADMGRKPTELHTIERKDNNKNYSPSNCFWATRKEQQNNTRQNVLLTLDGTTKTKQQWARELNISYTTLSYRIKANWPISDIFSTEKYTYHGKKG